MALGVGTEAASPCAPQLQLEGVSTHEEAQSSPCTSDRAHMDKRALLTCHPLGTPTEVSGITAEQSSLCFQGPF